MSRAITAIYRTHATASLVHGELERLGIGNHNITVLPHREIIPDTSSPTRSTTARADIDGALDSLNRLGLPDSDARAYQEAIRNGDHVVAVEVDDDAEIARIQEIMRRPEENFAAHATDSRGAHSNVPQGTRTVAAVYDSQSEAGEAVNRLRMAGVPDRCIRVAPTPSEKQELTDDDSRKGFWNSLGDFSLPDEDRSTYAEALARGSFLVVVHDVDSSLRDAVVDILDQESAVDLDARENEWRSSGWSGYPSSDRSYVDTTVASARDGSGMQDRSTPMATHLASQQAGFAETGSRGPSTGSAGDRDENSTADGTLKVVEERLNVGKREG